jgi:hypothetical protein
MAPTGSTRGARSTTVFVAAFVLAAAALLSLVVRPRASLVDLPLTEDGYYTLSVARHLALGHGITVDGQQRTNGIQPLLAFLLAPVYWLTGGDRYASLRGVLAVHWLLHIATALLLGLIARSSVPLTDHRRRRAVFWLTALLWVGSRFVLLNAYNGLETGLALLLYAAAWRCCQLGWLEGPRVWRLGLVLGLLVLARIDAAVFVATLGVVELLRREAPLRTRLWSAAVLTLVPFAVSLPWWLYSLFGFGSLMPSSGAAQAGPFAFWRVGALGQALLQVAAPFIQVRWIEGPLQTLAQAGVFAVVAWVFVRRVLPRVKGTETVRAGGVIALSTLLLGLYYLGFSAAAHFYGRYLAPLMLVTIPMTAVALVEVRRFRTVVQGAAAVALFTMAAVSAMAWDFQLGASRSGFYHDQLRLIEDHVPPADAVGAFQSGTIGYFRDRVLNLDGKVNPDALRRRGDSQAYVEERGVNWFCDWEGPFAGPGSPPGVWLPVATRGAFVLYRRVRIVALTSSAFR